MNRSVRALFATIVALAVVTSGIGVVGLAGAAPTDASAQEAECGYPVTSTDATGTEVTVEEEPEEVVVLGYNVAQTVWELDREEKVTGMPVDQYSAYLEGHDERTDVFTQADGYRQTDVEQVVDLDPDLVIAAGINSPDAIQQLRDNGLTVYQFGSAASIDEVREQTRTTGELLGACEEAEATVEWMNERLSVVEETVEGEETPTMLYWLPGGSTAGNGTFQHDLIELAGAENAGANMGIEGWAQPGDEDIVNEDPEYLLLERYGDEEPEVPDNAALRETTAVQEDNVVSVDANYFNQAAPRIVLAVEEIAQQLHPDAYEAATNETESDADGQTDEESDDGEADEETDGQEDGQSEDDGSTDESESDEETDDGQSEETGDDDETDGGADGEDGTDGQSDDVPGFGVPAAVAALVAALAAIARRD